MGIQRRKDLALLIYLVVTSQLHSRDTLANLLWPDVSQSVARSNLRKSLSRLKTILGEDALHLSQDQAGLNPGMRVQLDIVEFEKRVQQFREHGHRGKDRDAFLCADCQRSLEEAVRLYTADFLQGFTVPESSVFEEWQFFQSEHLRQALGEILGLLTYQHAFAGNYHVAIEYGRQWLSLDRLHEAAHRQLMRVFALSGQQAAALRQFEECRKLLQAELDVPPEQETLALFDTIKKKKVQGFSGTAAKISFPADNRQDQPVKSVHNFPAHPAPFIGRQKELIELTRFLADPSCRLLTLLGPGGNGKTRQATKMASSILDTGTVRFEDGIWFIPLAPLAEDQSIVRALVDGLHLTGHAKGSDARQKLLGHLRGRHLLLVLDNFEHLLTEDNVSLIVEILSAAPYITILVTSRERLNILGETIFRVEGLEIPTGESPQAPPETDAVHQTFSALLLFEQCARRIQSPFQITRDNYSDIAHICQQVQGMPLAIELAASWLEIFTISEINEEIARSLDFLESSRRDLPDRQRSVRAVFDSSWALLDRHMRPIVKALSLFRTSFTREAAQAVSGASLKALLELTNKSWLHRLSDGRYQIHELLRIFAYEKLSREAASLEQVKKQFCDHYSSYTASLWDKIKGSDQRQAYLGMQAEFDNIQTAWLWLTAGNKIHVAVQSMLPMLLHFCEKREKVTELRNMISEGLKAIHRLNRSPTRDKLEAILRTAEGSFHYDGFPLRRATYDGVFPIDVETSRRAWSLAQGLTFHELDFWAILLAYIHGRLIDVDDGVETLELLLPHFREANKSWELANTYLHISRLLITRGELAEHERNILKGYLSEAQVIFSTLGDHINTGYILSQWGELRSLEDDMQGAIQEWTAARARLLDQGEWDTANDILWQVCDAYLQLGSFQEAFDNCQQLAQAYFDLGLWQYAVTALSKQSYEQVRYGDLSEALRLREQCLDITREIGPEYQFGWNYWEMGEIMRVMVRLEDAADWYERSRVIFEKYDDYAGASFYYRGVGDLALAAQDYQAAYTAFLKSEPLAKKARHTWSLTYVTAERARAAIGLRDLAAAGSSLEQALRFSLKSRDKGITLVVILALADFLACQGEQTKALELGSLVPAHISSWHETRKRASVFMEGLQHSMTADEFDQARQRGQGMDLWETARRWASDGAQLKARG